MAIEIGCVVEGKITGLTRYGAFVALDGGAVGMVHISEVSYRFIQDISEHLQVGQSVNVKVLKKDETGRYSLSIKQAQKPEPVSRRPQVQASAAVRAPQQPMSFEDKLKEFMQSSDSRISDLRHNTDRKTGGRRGKR